MSQHVPETCDEGSGTWLPLTEYSVRSGISTSTIRRKIKSNSIRYRLVAGRYLLFLEDGRVAQAKPTVATPKPVEKIVRMEPVEQKVVSKPSEAKPRSASSATPIVERAVKATSEAFQKIISEKETRIRNLERRNDALSVELAEALILVQALEDKYSVRY